MGKTRAGAVSGQGIAPVLRPRRTSSAGPVSITSFSGKESTRGMLQKTRVCETLGQGRSRGGSGCAPEHPPVPALGKPLRRGH